MNNANTQAAMMTNLLNGLRAMPRGELLFDSLDGRLTRLHGLTADGMVELADRNTGAVLPDLRHPVQVCKARPDAAAVTARQLADYRAARVDTGFGVGLMAM